LDEEIVNKIAVGVADEITKRFQKVYASYRSDTADDIQNIIISLREARDCVSPEKQIDEAIDLVVGLRANLLELQEAVDNNAGVWVSDMRDEVVGVVVASVLS